MKVYLKLFMGAVTGLLLLSNGPIPFAHAANTSKQKKSILQAKQKQTKATIQSLRKQEAGLKQQSGTLLNSKEIWATQYKSEEAHLKVIKAQLRDLQKNIDHMETLIHKEMVAIDSTKSEITSDTSLLGFLLSATGFAAMPNSLPVSSMNSAQHQLALKQISRQRLKLAATKKSLLTREKMEQNLLDVVQSQKQQAAGNVAGNALMIKNTQTEVQQEQHLFKNEQTSLRKLEKQVKGFSGYSGPDSTWTWVVPHHTRITSPYGWRTWPDGKREFHDGIDIGAPLGTPIVSATRGRVLLAGAAQGFGDWIVIQSSHHMLEIYGHMYSWEIKVHPGELVAAGQEIALVGDNGLSTGPHLHFTVATGFKTNGLPNSVNPLKYVHP